MSEDTIWPRELPCPKCGDQHSIGVYESRDCYHCAACGADITGIDWRPWRLSGYGKN